MPCAVSLFLTVVVRCFSPESVSHFPAVVGKKNSMPSPPVVSRWCCGGKRASFFGEVSARVGRPWRLRCRVAYVPVKKLIGPIAVQSPGSTESRYVITIVTFAHLGLSWLRHILFVQFSAAFCKSKLNV